jgi:adenine-specific DNA-methyltransferase
MSKDSIEIHETPSTTPNFKNELAAQLADLLPEAIVDGKVDVEKLKELLDDDVQDESERFGLFWPGKKRALRAAQEPTTATLKPMKTDSKDWDTTQNVFIEGDNLEVLKILQKRYHNQIKMIYIDPPYNTGKDFIYPDNYKEGLQSYLEFTRQVDEGGRRLSTNSDTDGRYHSNWLNMMYPRLKLARNLLTDDGAIFVSIDDAEIDNLRKVMNEIFGESNFVGTMIWAAGRKNDSRFISTSHEYILCYARNFTLLREIGATWKVRKKGLDGIYKETARLTKKHQGDFEAATRDLKSWFNNLPDSDDSKRNSHYSRIDERGVYFADNISWPGGGGPKYDVLHPVTGRPVKIPARGWIFSSPETMRTHIESGKILFGADEKSVPTIKRYLRETETEAPYSVFYQDGRAATKRLRALMGELVFDFPKDETVLQTLVEMVTSGDDLIADFFAGSGTTAHAVMAANQEDGGSRRWLLVQLPEPTPEDSQAHLAGFRTITEIARRRIDLAGNKILVETEGMISTRQEPLDIGFRYYGLADTNFTKWKLSSDTTADALEQRLLELRDSSDDAASPGDLLTEILLKQGFSLTEQVEQASIAGLNVYSVGGNTLLAYLDEHATPTLAQLRTILDLGPAKFIILEDSLQGDDELKTNLKQICKTKQIELWTA